MSKSNNVARHHQRNAPPLVEARTLGVRQMSSAIDEEVVARVLERRGFTVRKGVAAGAHATVVVAKHVKSGRLSLVKVVRDTHLHRSELMAGLSLAGCAGVAKMRRWFVVDMSPVTLFFMVFDYESGSKDLQVLYNLGLADLSTKVVRQRFVEVARALAACHDRGIAHRDIKMENIAYAPSTGRCMLIDFGLCFFTVDAAPTAAPHASGKKIIRRHFDLAAGREDTRFLRDNSMACAFDLTRH
jgi:hypothetical protein